MDTIVPDAAPGSQSVELAHHRSDGFIHEAALYAGSDGFLEATLPFISCALDSGEPIFVAVSDQKIVRLSEALGAHARRVQFADMAVIGVNPARIIPAWFQFVDSRPSSDVRVWGIGEPIGPDRSDQALVECQRHESLLNVAFAETPRFNLLCPYDTDVLDEAVLDEAQCSHPLIVHQGVREPSALCRSVADAGAPFDVPLSPRPSSALEVSFDGLASLPIVRGFAEREGRAAGLRDPGGLVLVINELVANSLVHGGGKGVVRMWSEDDQLVCEVSDRGRIDAPLAGRRPPAPGQYGGWGLWLANQLCELVQVRSFEHGSTVRAYLKRD